jgi:hypothetical protein
MPEERREAFFNWTGSLPSDLVPSGFTINILYALIMSPMRATCPGYLILLDSIIVMIFIISLN